MNTLLLSLSYGLLTAEVESTKLVRHRALAGVSVPLVERAWTLHGDALGGYLLQTGTLARRGPGAELRLGTQRSEGRLRPYALGFGAAHALPHKQTILRPEGEEVGWSIEPEWSYGLRTGLGLVFLESGELSVGLDQRWVDAPIVAIPGLHAGLSWSF